MSPQTPADGNRLLVVAQELVMTLFCVLYAFPHVPSRILDANQTTVWYSIGSMDALRSAITNLLQTSPVIQAAVGPGKAVSNVTYRTACDPDLLNDQLNLTLHHHNVPVTCRQMYRLIAAMYTVLTSPDDITTREHMQQLFQRMQFLSPAFRLPTDRSDRTGLLRFCSQCTTEWMQPYFASHPLFFYPSGLTGVCGTSA